MREPDLGLDCLVMAGNKILRLRQGPFKVNISDLLIRTH